MGKCKNIECNNETLGKRVYCSLTCRNVYVNKHLRDYSSNAEGLSKKDDYMPKKCENCGQELPYEKRNNKYCSNSCSASYNNHKRKGIKYVLSDKGLESLKKSALTNLLGVNVEKHKKMVGEYQKNPNNCKNCGKPLTYKKRENVFCDMACKKEYYQKTIEEYRRYQLDCRFDFNLSDYEEEFNFGLIGEHGWYSPSNSNKPNLSGVSRDHIFSVRRGFELAVDPEIIKHPANCKLMIHGENIGKGKKCDINIEELKEKIKVWDEKYHKKT